MNSIDYSRLGLQSTATLERQEGTCVLRAGDSWGLRFTPLLLSMIR